MGYRSAYKVKHLAQQYCDLKFKFSFFQKFGNGRWINVSQVGNWSLAGGTGWGQKPASFCSALDFVALKVVYKIINLKFNVAQILVE